MGRRSINTTKSGKFMNPTDRARKEARRKELKKNKKQRMAVRQAVLKSKDAQILLEEATLYDQQEYDPKSETTLSERVLQEKRKKLMETYDRMIALYKREDPDKAQELLAMKTEYDKKRNDMIQYYDQVKLAEKVKATEIPLPEIPPQNLMGLPQYPGDIPLPPGLNIPPHPSVLAAAASLTAVALKPSNIPIPPSAPPARSILKKSDSIPGPPLGLPVLHKKPCAPPPGSPDELSEVESDASSSDEDNDLVKPTDLSDDDDEENNNISKSKKIRFAEDKSNNNASANKINIDRHLLPGNFHSQMPLPYPRPGMHGISLPMMPPPPSFLQPSNIPVPSGIPPPPMINGPPGYHPNSSVSASISVPAQMFNSTASNRSNKKLSDIPLPILNQHTAKLKPFPSATETLASGKSTIEAKPQLKNLIGDSTKLVPSSLLSRKAKTTTNAIGGGGGVTASSTARTAYRPHHPVNNKGQDTHQKGRYGDIGASKDDAYDQFMKEMQGLL